MADDKTAQEPSMEEILSSIRRIIAEDEAGGQPAAAIGEGMDEQIAAPEDEDVLELTEIVDEPETAAAAPDASVPEAPTKPAPTPSNAAQEHHAMTAQTAAPLISTGAAAASTNAFARLAKAAAPGEQRQVAVAGLTVEQLVVDLLTPIMRDWLDQNLPAIVERVVEQEVKKLARRAELT